MRLDGFEDLKDDFSREEFHFKLGHQEKHLYGMLVQDEEGFEKEYTIYTRDDFNMQDQVTNSWNDTKKESERLQKPPIRKNTQVMDPNALLLKNQRFMRGHVFTSMVGIEKNVQSSQIQQRFVKI
jgi:hypothetical protein